MVPGAELLPEPVLTSHQRSTPQLIATAQEMFKIYATQKLLYIKLQPLIREQLAKLDFFKQHRSDL